MDVKDVELSSHHVIPAAAIALTVLLFLYNIYRHWAGPLAHLPGPTLSKYTGLGVRLRMGKGLRTAYLETLHKKYGPIVRVTPNEVSVADTSAAREIHKTSGGYIKSEFYSNFNMWEWASIFPTRDVVEHAKIRRLLSPTMAESNIKHLDGVVQEKVDLLLSQLKKEQKERGVVDVYKWYHYFSTDVITTLSFGESFRMLEHGKTNQYMEDVQSIGKLNMVRTMVIPRPLYATPNLPIWPIRKAYNLRARLLDYSKQSIQRYQRHVEEHPEAETPMLFSRIMGQKGDYTLTLDQIAIQAQGYLVAGTDTTAITGTYLIWAIAGNPAIRAKFEAATSHLSDKPTSDELKAVPYLEHLLDETLRLYGAAPAPLPRTVPKGGRTLGGYFVPEGLTVSPVAHVLHRDPNVFPDPETFNPDRWENPTKDMRDSFFPFGGGSRVCIGLHLARMELRMLAFSFFRNFPAAVRANDVEGFCDDDMELRDFFIFSPKGKRCLIQAAA